MRDEDGRAVGRARARGGDNWLYGRHAVGAALANPARRWRRLVVLAGQESEAAALIADALAEQHGGSQPVEALDRAGFERLLPQGAVHQGWALEVEPLENADLEDLLRAVEVRQGRATVLVLDQVTDPHNFGAIVRTAAAFGLEALITTHRHSPQISGVLAKAASGGLEYVPLINVTNLARALDTLGEYGFSRVGLDSEAPKPLEAIALSTPLALVLGAEGQGLRRLTREKCDVLARLDLPGPVQSLNVSNACAIALALVSGALRQQMGGRP